MVAILLEDADPTMFHYLPDMPHNDVLACDIGPSNSPITLICIYRHSGGKFTTVISLTTLLRTLFDDSRRFILDGDLNAGHVD